MAQLDGKVIIITGAAGGLGSRMSTLMAERGAKIAVADIRLDGAEETVQAVRAAGGQAIAIEVDIASEEQAKAMVRKTVEAFGGLDVLVNNAGGVMRGASEGPGDMTSLADLDVAVWDANMRVNARGTMLCSKYAIPAMLARGGGSIVNIASVAGLKAGETLAAYGASKAAVISLTRHVAVAYGKQNIRCNAICPGSIPHERNRRPGRASPAMTQTTHVLLDHLGKSDDIAYAAAFLASDESGFITGQALPVDGGSTVGRMPPPARD